MRIFHFVLAPSLLTMCIVAGACTSSSTSSASASTTPRGWVAHSAYGLQIAVPKSWTVRTFQNCPGRGPGTLLIGTPLIYDFCPMIPSNANIVTMERQRSGSASTPRSHVSHLVVNGLRITRLSGRGPTMWAIPSHHAVVVLRGPAGPAVARTLAPATSRAQSAPGLLVGTEQLVAVQSVNVTGPISVIRLDAHGPALPPLRAIDGEFSTQLPPGRYQLRGQDGNASCPAKVIRIVAGEVRRVALTCQGI